MRTTEDSGPDRSAGIPGRPGLRFWLAVVAALTGIVVLWLFTNKTEEGGGPASATAGQVDSARVAMINANWRSAAAGDQLADALARSLAIRGGVGSDGYAPTIHEVESPGAVEFPPGVGYAQASAWLWLAGNSGMAPPSVRLVPALPKGIVLRIPKDRGQGISVDLIAPFGYEPESGQIVGNLAYAVEQADGTFAGPEAMRSISASNKGALWLPGTRTITPILDACMVDPGDGVAESASCSVPSKLMPGRTDSIAPQVEALLAAP